MLYEHLQQSLWCLYLVDYVVIVCRVRVERRSQGGRQTFAVRLHNASDPLIDRAANCYGGSHNAWRYSSSKSWMRKTRR